MRRPLAALALAIGLLPGAVHARPGAGHRPLVGVPLAVQLLESEDAVARTRGVERLAAIGTTEAIDALVEAVDQNTPWMRDPRLRLTTIRALAGETKRDNVRQWLLHEVTDTVGSDGRSSVSPLAPVVRGTAALALARGGDVKAQAGLVTALLQGGMAGDAAANALRVYPPASIESFLEGRRRLTPGLAAFLGEIGDLRAVEPLRAMLQEPDEAGKAAAAVALAKLGDESALEAAVGWVKKNDSKLQRAAAEALAYLGAPEANTAIAALLGSPASRLEGLNLALIAPSPLLAAPLMRALPELSDDLRPMAVAAIGRAGGWVELVALLEKPETFGGAAFALATVPGKEARRALASALGSEKSKKPEVHRALLRAAIMRALVLDDPPEGLRKTLVGLLADTSPGDRALAAFGLVATGSMTLERALAAACKTPITTCDEPMVAAAARGALALPAGPSSLDPLLHILVAATGGSDPRFLGASLPDVTPLAIATASVLLAHPDGGGLPTSVLATWAEGGSVLAPLAALALPSRDDDALRGRLRRLLEGTDPVVRAHVALGLANDPEPSAATLLTGAYRFEEDATVRRAIVRGLSCRTEVQRIATLTVARDLDPDDETRALAGAALQGHRLAPELRPALGVEPRRSVAWVAIVGSDGRSTGVAHAARLVRSDGLAVPTLSDPDGVLLMPGLPPGPARLHVEGAP